MLYNSDGLPVIFMVYQKVYIFKCNCWYILPVFAILSKQNENRKNMQYENNLRKKLFYREKKQQQKNKIWFSKILFSKRYIWKKGGRLIIRVVLYSVNMVVL